MPRVRQAERANWTDPSCPVARAADLIGDRWTLLIIRDAFDGARSFTDFQHRTGIARNILTDRLRRLGEYGLMAQEPAPTGKRNVYVLTKAGIDLFTVIVALRQWGERNAFADDESHSVLLGHDGAALATLRPVDTAGVAMTPQTTSVRHDRP